VPVAAPVAAPAAAEGVAVGQGGDGASETLADFLRQRDVELRDIRDRMAGADTQMDSLKAEFEAYQRTHPDDLTVIKGIGPVYQWKLRDAGCNSYKQLAAADPDQLRRMLDIKNWQRVNIEAWVSQARDWAQRG
jgi:predicted flap endonuclease-1-like 5' DNA nuclease